MGTWNRYIDNMSSTPSYSSQAGTLFRYTTDSRRTFNFRREKGIGRDEKLLIADSVELSAQEWQEFMERGHGFHATSIVTRAIARLGEYIAEVEGEFDIYSEKDLEDRLKNEPLPELQAKHKAIYQRYKMVQLAQQKLRELYELERKIDPAYPEQEEAFKATVIDLLTQLRDDNFRISAFHNNQPVTSIDQITAVAIEEVGYFNWPIDPSVADETRRRPISERDQLLPKEGQRYVYNPRIDAPSAAGSYLPNVKGFGAEGRDNFALCLSRLGGFQNDAERIQFRKDVKFLLPSSGVLTSPGLLLRKVSELSGVVERNYPEESEGTIDTADDPLLYAKAREYAAKLEWVEKEDINLEVIDEERAGVDFSSLLAFKKNKRIEFGPSLYTDINKKKIEALALFDKLVELPDGEYQQLKQQKKEIINAILNPYRDLYQLEQARKVKQNFEKDFTTEIQSLQLNKKDLTHEDIQTAILKAMQKATPTFLVPEGLQGPTFLRSNAFGSVYVIADAIAGVLESMGHRDPVYGTVALAVTGVMSAYVMMIGLLGHGSIAAAGAKSKFVADLSNAKVFKDIFPVFYKGLLPVDAGSGMLHIIIAALADGFVLGKLAYFLQSGVDRIATGNKKSFASEVLGAMWNTPVETAVVLAMLWGLGHGFIKVMHEESTLGTWKIFDEIGGSIKPAAVSFDFFLALCMSMKKLVANKIEYDAEVDTANTELAIFLTKSLLATLDDKQRENFSDEDQHKIEELIKEILITEGTNVTLEKIMRHVLSGMNNKKELGIAFQKLSANNGMQPIDQEPSARAENVDVKQSAPVREQKLPDVLSDAAAVMTDNQADVRVSPNVVSTVAQQTFSYLESKVEEKNNLEKISRKAFENLLTAYDGHQFGFTQDSGTIKKVRKLLENNPDKDEFPLNEVLESFYPKEAEKYHADEEDPVAQKARQEYLQKLMYIDLTKNRIRGGATWDVLTTGEHRKLVRQLTGQSVEHIEQQQVPATAVMMGLLRSLPGGIARTVWGLTAGVVASAVRLTFRNYVSHETLRTYDKWTGVEDLKGVGEGIYRAGAFLVRVPGRMGHVPSMATWRTGLRISPRDKPEDIARQQLNEQGGSVTQTVLAVSRKAFGKGRDLSIARPSDVPIYRNSMTKLVVISPEKPQVIPTLNKNLLKVVIAEYDQRKKSFFKSDSYIMKKIKELLRKDSQEFSALEVLKAILPGEVAMLQKQGADDQVMYASLQRILREEILVAKDESKTTYTALTLYQNRAVLDALIGRSALDQSQASKVFQECDDVIAQNREALAKNRCRLLLEGFYEKEKPVDDKDDMRRALLAGYSAPLGRGNNRVPAEEDARSNKDGYVPPNLKGH